MIDEEVKKEACMILIEKFMRDKIRKQTLEEVDKWVEEEFKLKIGYVSLIKFRKKFGLEGKK